MRTSLRLTLAGHPVHVRSVSGTRPDAEFLGCQDLPEAQQIAHQEQRLLLIHFYSDTCPPCRRLEQVVFPNPEVYRAMSMNYIPVKINGERARDTAMQFQVDRWPTDVIADAQGRVLYKTVSPQDPARYVQLLNAVAADFRATMAPVAAAGRASPPAESAAGYALAAYNNRSDPRAAPVYPAADPRTGPENSPRRVRPAVRGSRCGSLRRAGPRTDGIRLAAVVFRRADAPRTSQSVRGSVRSRVCRESARRKGTPTIPAVRGLRAGDGRRGPGSIRPDKPSPRRQMATCQTRRRGRKTALRPIGRARIVRRQAVLRQRPVPRPAHRKRWMVSVP